MFREPFARSLLTLLWKLFGLVSPCPLWPRLPNGCAERQGAKITRFSLSRDQTSDKTRSNRHFARIIANAGYSIDFFSSLPSLRFCHQSIGRYCKINSRSPAVSEPVARYGIFPRLMIVKLHKGRSVIGRVPSTMINKTAYSRVIYSFRSRYFFARRASANRALKSLPINSSCSYSNFPLKLRWFLAL